MWFEALVVTVLGSQAYVTGLAGRRVMALIKAWRRFELAVLLAVIADIFELAFISLPPHAAFALHVGTIGTTRSAADQECDGSRTLS